MLGRPPVRRIAAVVIAVQTSPIIYASAQRPELDSTPSIVEIGEIDRSPALSVLSPAPRLVFGPGLNLMNSNPFASAKLLADGRFMIIDYDHVILVDSGGAVTGTIPRAGQANGGAQIRDACIGAHDAITLIGYTRHQLSVFTLTGQPLGVVPFDGVVGPDACYPDGFVMVRRPSRSPQQTSAATTETLLHLSITGVVLDSAVTSLVHTFDHGTPFVSNVVPARARILIADRLAPEYRVIAPSGTSLQIVRWKQRGRLPALGHLKVDSRGRAWVELPVDSNRVPVWAVFDSSGHLIGRVLMPRVDKAQANLANVDSNYVTLVSRNDQGQLRISIHALRFP